MKTQTCNTVSYCFYIFCTADLSHNTGGQFLIIHLREHLFTTYDCIVKNYSVETEELINENLDEDLLKGQKNAKYYFFARTLSLTG